MTKQSTKKLRPMLLSSDNFTQLSRTPWAGTNLAATIKADVAAPGSRIGEAWEFSIADSHPSHINNNNTLKSLLTKESSIWCSDERPTCELLIKLIDAAHALSVQIHPRGDEDFLQPTQSGKPEAWYIVAADAESVIYLGFKPGTTELQVRREIEHGDMRSLLIAHPVSPGDVFLLEPGTAHAIGAGVTLVEPQRVRPGRDGVTFRYWDWNRRYAADGTVDPDGSPRELHIDEALAVTDWNRDFRKCIKSFGAPDRRAPATFEWLVHSSTSLSWEHFLFARLFGTGELANCPKLPAALAGITVLSGKVELRSPDGDILTVTAGTSAAIPAKIGEFSLNLSNCHATLAFDGNA